MSDIIDNFRAINKAKQDQAAANRSASTLVLRDHGIQFTSHNNGAHLIVQGKAGFIDFWPGTAKWFDRKSRRYGFGVNALVAFVTPA